MFVSVYSLGWAVAVTAVDGCGTVVGLVDRSAPAPDAPVPVPNCPQCNDNKPHSQTLSLSLHFNGHFPGEPGLAGVY